MSRWMPNTLTASSTVLTGVTLNALIEEDDNTSLGWGKFKVYLDVRPSQMPGNQTFYRVRYHGRVELEINPPEGIRLLSASHVYDYLIDQAVAAGVDKPAVLAQISQSLTGRVVTLSRLGGRWMIQ